MRDLHELDQYRLTDQQVIDYYGSTGDDRVGAFIVPSPVDRAALLIVASSDFGWDHVSVSKRKRVPSYREMVYVKKLFFKPDEVAMELHVPEDQHVNVHPNCLHLWRPLDVPIPLPPTLFIGPKG